MKFWSTEDELFGVGLNLIWVYHAAKPIAHTIGL